jgi:hypothetical protein
MQETHRRFSPLKSLAAAAVLVLTLAVSVGSVRADIADPLDDTFEGASQLAPPAPVWTTIPGERDLGVASGDTEDWFSGLLPKGTYYYTRNGSSTVRLQAFLVDPFSGNFSTLTPRLSSISFTLNTSAIVAVVASDFIGSGSYAIEHRADYPTGGGGSGSAAALPTLKFNSYPASTSWPKIGISGTAAPSVDTKKPIREIQWRSRTNSTDWSGWRTANGKKNWSFSINLSGGSNLIQVRAIDTKGKSSVIGTIVVHRL